MHKQYPTHINTVSTPRTHSPSSQQREAPVKESGEPRLHSSGEPRLHSLALHTPQVEYIAKPWRQGSASVLGSRSSSKMKSGVGNRFFPGSSLTAERNHAPTTAHTKYDAASSSSPYERTIRLFASHRRKECASRRHSKGRDAVTIAATSIRIFLADLPVHPVRISPSRFLEHSWEARLKIASKRGKMDIQKTLGFLNRFH